MATFIKTISTGIRYWYMPLIVGFLWIALGIYIAAIPGVAYLALTLFFSASFIVSGIGEIFFSIQNRKVIDEWGWFLITGIANLTIGVALFTYPGLSAATLAFFVGFNLLFRSFQGLGIAINLRNYNLHNWRYQALASAVGIIFSLFLIAHPLFAALSLVFVTALTLVFIGISGVVLAFGLKRLKDLTGNIRAAHDDQVQMA